MHVGLLFGLIVFGFDVLLMLVELSESVVRMRCIECLEDERLRNEGTALQFLILAFTVVVETICGLDSQVVCELGLVKSVYSI
jgi:hypothetical protein